MLCGIFSNVFVYSFVFDLPLTCLCVFICLIGSVLSNEVSQVESFSSSQNQTAVSHIGGAMLPGVSTSLDSAALHGAGLGMQHNAAGAGVQANRNLFKSQFANLVDVSVRIFDCTVLGITCVSYDL